MHLAVCTFYYVNMLLRSADTRTPSLNPKTSTAPVHLQPSSPDSLHLVAQVRLASFLLPQCCPRLDRLLCAFAGRLCAAGLLLRAAHVPARISMCYMKLVLEVITHFCLHASALLGIKIGFLGRCWGTRSIERVARRR